MRNLVLVLCLFCGINALATPSVEILAYGSDHGAWPADNLCFPANSHPTPFQGGWILPQTCVGGSDTLTQLWYVHAGKAQKIGASAPGNFFTDAATDGTTIAFAEFNESGTLSVTQTNLILSHTDQLPTDWGSRYLRSFNIISASQLQFRYTDGDRNSVAGSLQNGQFSEFKSSGISYYFGAITSRALRVEKLRLGQPGQLDESAPDEIVVGMSPLFSPVIVARDHDADSSSQYTSFYNDAGVQGHHWAMLAQAAQGTVMLRGLDARVETVPLYSQFKTVEYFAPAVLNDGRIVLRATNLQGVVGLWIIDLQNQAHLLLQKGSLVSNERGQFALGATPFVTGPASAGDDVVIGIDLENPSTHEVMEQDVVRVIP